jgi:hypothetical protein
MNLKRWFGASNAPASRLAQPTPDQLEALLHRAMGDQSALVPTVHIHGGRAWVVHEPFITSPTTMTTLVEVGRNDPTP